MRLLRRQKIGRLRALWVVTLVVTMICIMCMRSMVQLQFAKAFAPPPPRQSLPFSSTPAVVDDGDATSSSILQKLSKQHRFVTASPILSVLSVTAATTEDGPSWTPLATNSSRDALKTDLLRDISSTPSNAPTSRTATRSILTTIRALETMCPMEHNGDSDDGNAETKFLDKLAGNWELLWTTQDDQSDEWNMAGPFRRWINPLENQSYSNNPLGSSNDDAEGRTGRANPILPRPIQDRLEELGVIDTTSNSSSGDSSEPLVRSRQSIDLTKRLVRNVVTFRVPSLNNNNKPTTVTLTVAINFWPDTSDKRKINVKFDSCRVRILPKPAFLLLPVMADFTIPLGIIGPTGWLRTTYLDHNLRITRGFKGSVFVLARPSATTTKKQSKS